MVYCASLVLYDYHLINHHHHRDRHDYSNFLPQERVHAFAQLSPNERLKETMSTIGGAKMVEQYEQLSTLRLQETELTVTCERDGADIEDLERRNDRLRPDVERYLKRDEIVQNVKSFHGDVIASQLTRNIHSQHTSYFLRSM